MTSLMDRPTAGAVEPDGPPPAGPGDTARFPRGQDTAPPASEDGAPATGEPQGEGEGEVEAPLEINRRALAIAMLSTSGAALMTGGMFGSWAARLVGVLAAGIGVGWAFFTLSAARRTIRLLVLPPLLLLVGSLSLIGSDAGPGGLPDAVGDAIQSGRVLRPPIPFDAGWRPILIVILGLVGFAAAYVGASGDKPTTALAMPVPLLALTGMSQPKEGQLLAGLLGVVPLLAALAMLYGNDLGGGPKLSRQFELQRALRSAGLVAAAVAALILLNTTSFLFPPPAYDPNEAAQKPKAVPLNATEDKVLFEVAGPITGPWKMGHLDVYDGTAWRLPPFSAKRLVPLQGDGAIAATPPEKPLEVTFTVRGLGTSAVLPGVVDPASVVVQGEYDYDPRGGVVRQRTGRVPEALTYTMTRAPYPGAAVLEAAGAPGPDVPRSDLDVPDPPPSVAGLLAEAPQGPYQRLDFLLRKMNEVVVAAGEGTPVDVPPSTVERIFVGNHEASPYEIVGAQALLARWAGLPSRIGFGFDGVQEEGGIRTVRPRNAAQWLEVRIEGVGWVPIITAPPKAKASLNDDTTRKDPTILPSDDVAVEVLIPVKVVTAKQLYEKVRLVILRILPFALLAAAVYAAAPTVERSLRRRRRRAWAAGLGPEAQIVVEYVELRELATDLGVGHPTKTAIEFLDEVEDDDEHEELAWLVTRALYGDLAGQLGPEDVTAAEELSASVRRRLRKGQPLQSRVLAAITRTTLREPFTREVPTFRKAKAPRRRPAPRQLLARATRRLPRPVRALVAPLTRRRGPVRARSRLLPRRTSA